MKNHRSDQDLYGVINLDYSNSIILPLEIATDIYKYLVSGVLVEGYSKDKWKIKNAPDYFSLKVITEADLKEVKLAQALDTNE
jgi:hypothetical protein